MRFSIQYRILMAMIFCFTTMVGQQEVILKKGSITGDLKTPDYTKSLYSIYLPTNFDVSKKWPVLIGFDSSKDPYRFTSFLKTTAEKLGFVVVVSNFSKKSAINDKADYVAAFLNHLFNTLPLDHKRIYAIAYGEDAVLTSALPIVFKEFDGVIAIGDSFNYIRNEKIRKNFYYAAVVGDQDHNYLGLQKIRRFLKLKAVPAEVYTYQGSASLPDPELMTKVVGSFRIRDMVNGKIAKDSVWLKSMYEKNINEVDTLVANNDLLGAHKELRKMIDTYKFIRDTEPLKKKLKGISRTREYRKARNQWQLYSNEERWWREEFSVALQEDLGYYGFDNLGWWRFRMKELEKALSSDIEVQVDMGVRLKAYVQMLLIAADNQVMIYNKATTDQRLLIKVLKTVVNPKDFNSYLKIISLSAKDGDYPTALFYLEELLKNGYTDVKSLYSIEGTLSLKLTKGYNDIIKKYLKTSGYQQYQ